MALVTVIPGIFTTPGLPTLGLKGFSDAFTRPDAATLGVVEGFPRRPWAVWVQSGTAIHGIAGGEGYAYRDTPGHTLATVDAEAADGTLEVTMGTVAAGAQAGPLFRAVDDSNYIRLVHAQSSSEYRLQKFEGGTLTRLDEGFAVAAAEGDRVRIILDGPSITVIVNDVQVGQFTDATHQDATRHGFYNNTQGSTIRDVKFTA